MKKDGAPGKKSQSPLNQYTQRTWEREEGQKSGGSAGIIFHCSLNWPTVQRPFRFTLFSRTETYLGVIKSSFSLYCQEWEVNLHFLAFKISLLPGQSLHVQVVKC